MVTLGSYEQDNNKNNGTEPIEWRVLDIQGNEALLISRYVLDRKDYHSKQTSVTWDTCYIRTWLNTNFFSNAFTTEEQRMIQTTTVKAQKNPHYSADPKNGIGKNTQDKIFLLNVVEAEKYFDGDWERQCKGTKYALAQGVSTDGTYCNWMLRQPHKFGTTTPCVNWQGSTDDSCNVSGVRSGVRPAMWVDINLLPGYAGTKSYQVATTPTPTPKPVAQRIQPRSSNSKYEGKGTKFDRYYGIVSSLNDMLDNNINTCFGWLIEMSQYQGDQVQFTFNFDGEDITALKIRNGNAKSQNNYYKYARLTTLKLKIYYNGTWDIETIDIPDVYSSEYFEHTMSRKYTNVSKIEVMHDQDGRVAGNDKERKYSCYITDIMFMGY